MDVAKDERLVGLLVLKVVARSSRAKPSPELAGAFYLNGQVRSMFEGPCNLKTFETLRGRNLKGQDRPPPFGFSPGSSVRPNMGSLLVN